LLGYGYQSIWMGDSTETIALQRMTGITDGRQFHFHHQFRQIAVDTGYVGLVAFVGVLIATFFAGMRQLLLHPSVPTSFFFILFMLMATRSFTDVIIAPLQPVAHARTRVSSLLSAVSRTRALRSDARVHG
jgi:O-antigen ligase